MNDEWRLGIDAEGAGNEVVFLVVGAEDEDAAKALAERLGG